MSIMCPAALLFALLLAVNQAPSPHRLDAASDARLDQTTAVVRAELAEAQRAKFDQAMKILMADFIDKQDDGATKEQFVAGWLALLQGKTANEVIAAAEAIVRKMIDDHTKERATTVSRALTGTAAARGASFACESLLSTSIKPEPVDQAEYFEVTETSLLKPESETRRLIDRQQLAAAAAAGTDTLAIELDGNTVKLMTRASVEMGQASPATFAIMRNDESVLLAFAVEEALLGIITDSLLFNKTNGLAVWTKSRSASLLGEQPTTQSIYLRCR